MKYRKKPVEIEALMWDPDDLESVGKVVAWLRISGADFATAESPRGVLICLRTLEGTMTASPGDFIIRGVQGEFYPCKPDIFRETHDAVA